MRKRYLCALFAALSALFVAVAALQTRNNLPTVADSRPLILLDAGHGGFDGGTVASDDTVEKDINLEVTTDLSVVLRLLGYRVAMTRDTDTALDDDPTKTIRERKRADMAARLALYDAASLVISIHQNHFTDSKYSGAQVFYNRNDTGQRLAEIMQTNLVQTVNRNSNRKSKKADGVYLMEHAQIPGVLVECGFLSNTAEDVKLRTPEYQKKLCCVIGATLSQFLNS